ncbi:hypothetical protein NPIL_415481 [Nephila pilipes]|uniref:Uncharacterized protein n=1 Tax=Nephila pilipes TaxID=299642 RepID=A0A8X6MAZ1_NEPPI|nr:hypothetical protein NPIL_415481 [Nephila pilipes]
MDTSRRLGTSDARDYWKFFQLFTYVTRSGKRMIHYNGSQSLSQPTYELQVQCSMHNGCTSNDIRRGIPSQNTFTHTQTATFLATPFNPGINHDGPVR